MQGLCAHVRGLSLAYRIVGLFLCCTALLQAVVLQYAYTPVGLTGNVPIRRQQDMAAELAVLTPVCAQGGYRRPF